MSYQKLKIANELLHFFKTGKNSFSGILIDFFNNSRTLCPFLHGPKTNTACYLSNPAISDLLILMKKYICCFEYLDIDVYGLQGLKKDFEELKDPAENYNLKSFKSNLQSFISSVKFYEQKVYQLDSLLTCEECCRLDEAINSFENYCYHSSVIMSVSAVEARLHYLIRTKNLSVYRKFFEDATLGQIIKLIDPNEYKDRKFKSIKQKLPAVYKPLIEVLNIYRVFSAHPKAKRIDFKTAQSVLNLSFNFLLSLEARIKDKKILAHKIRKEEKGQSPNKDIAI